MILTVFERANLLGLLPSEGNIKTLRTVTKAREVLSLSDEENKRWQPTVDEKGLMMWKVIDDDGMPIPQEADVEISELAFELIREALVKVEGEEKLKLEHYSLYEKFVEKEYKS